MRLPINRAAPFLFLLIACSSSSAVEDVVKYRVIKTVAPSKQTLKREVHTCKMCSYHVGGQTVIKLYDDKLQSEGCWNISCE